MVNLRLSPARAVLYKTGIVSWIAVDTEFRGLVTPDAYVVAERWRTMLWL